MKPVRLWIGLVFVTLGVFGILDATGTLDSSETIDKWWPVAIIGLGLIGMLVERRIAIGPGIVVVIGFLLLADQQQWTHEDLFGPVILIAIGLRAPAVPWGPLPREALDPHQPDPWLHTPGELTRL